MTEAPAPRSSGAALLLAAACAGAAVMALEVLAGRVMAPAVGTGSAAWASLLAVALGALAVGNLVGGVLAGRSCPGAIIAWALALTGASTVATGAFHHQAMQWAGELPPLAGTVAAALAGQLVPMLLLGTVSPAIVVAGRTRGSPGRWAGAVLAAGSAGGIAGALGIGLAGLPALGIGRCYAVVAAAVCVVALAPALHGQRWRCAVVVVAVLAASAWLWNSRADAGVIHSPLGQIEVRHGPEGSMLLIDGLPQSAWPGAIERWDGLRNGYLLEAALVVAGEPRDALVIGLGAGLAPRLLETHGVRCLSVELDEAVVHAARRQFAFTGEVLVADGRKYLTDTDAQWDLIVLDVCTSDRLALHLFTIEAMRRMRSRLTPGGLLAVQFIGDDGPWSASLAATVKAAFGEAIVLAPRVELAAVGPRWLLAGRRSLPPASMMAGSVDAPPPWRVVVPEGAGVVLTDDRFAAERDWSPVARAWRRSYRR